MSSKLLIDEYPLLVLPTLANIIGLNEAIFLQQANYCEQKFAKNFDGEYWFKMTIAEDEKGYGWRRFFPFWHESTIKRVINNLRKSGYLEATQQFNKSAFDKSTWYRINHNALDEKLIEISGKATVQIDPSEQTKLNHRTDQVEPSEQVKLNRSRQTKLNPSIDQIEPIYKDVETKQETKETTAENTHDKIAVVSGDESPGAAIAAMKNNGIEAAKAAELVTLHGPERCLSEVDKAKFAAQKGAVRESVAAWIIGSLATPNGFSPPKGYQPPAERLAAEVAAAKRAEIARKKREAEEAAEQLRREQFEQLLAIYNDLPESEQRKIAERVINDFANKGEFQKFRIESWRKDGSSNFLIFKYRKVMFRDEFISVMLENEQEKAG